MARGAGHFRGGEWSFGAAKLYECSRQVPFINDFLSHSWQDGRWKKFVALGILYNSTAALMVSLAMAACLCVGQRYDVIPSLWGVEVTWVIAGQEVDLTEGSWAFLGAPFGFSFIWLYWQWLRTSMFGSCRNVFLDKLCIHQADEALKMQGIRSIGGILKFSRRLVVFWSPLYFSRLWCMFEVAVWVWLGRADQLKFLPLPKAQLVPLGMGFSYSILALLIVMQALGELSALTIALTATPVLVATPCLVHIMRRMLRDLLELKSQLENISINDCETWCCTNQHIHPDTGMPMKCDRELIMDCVGNLFPSKDPAALFDKTFRKRFVPHITGTIGGPDALPFSWCILMMAPLLWRGFDVLAVDAPPATVFRIILTYIIYMMIGIVAIRMLMFVCCRLAFPLPNRTTDMVVSCIVALLWIVAFGALFYLSHRARAIRALWPLLVNCMVLCGIVVALFWCEFKPPKQFSKRHSLHGRKGSQVRRSMQSGRGSLGSGGSQTRRSMTRSVTSLSGELSPRSSQSMGSTDGANASPAASPVGTMLVPDPGSARELAPSPSHSLVVKESFDLGNVVAATDNRRRKSSGAPSPSPSFRLQVLELDKGSAAIPGSRRSSDAFPELNTDRQNIPGSRRTSNASFEFLPPLNSVVPESETKSSSANAPDVASAFKGGSDDTLPGDEQVDRSSQRPGMTMEDLT
eukprot:gnl/TRDRNA2_/TRDRNA2_165680_c2_seq1.p1 gnl/TRDRNA2_/TRDRNA2_165680_c2~~gnl/TRDRNA2_/TRDRNA2_165680_c2_seq1.p1  ORF type:complete len:733 (+),score=89.28 gnl/TRDRNA2_/TRDRNA2_165680_c2_seq1:128-2200(+)